MQGILSVYSSALEAISALIVVCGATTMPSIEDLNSDQTSDKSYSKTSNPQYNIQNIFSNGTITSYDCSFYENNFSNTR